MRASWCRCVCLKHDIFVDVNTLSSLLMPIYRNRELQKISMYIRHTHTHTKRRGTGLSAVLKLQPFFLFIELDFTIMPFWHIGYLKHFSPHSMALSVMLLLYISIPGVCSKWLEPLYTESIQLSQICVNWKPFNMLPWKYFKSLSYCHFKVRILCLLIYPAYN